MWKIKTTRYDYGHHSGQDLSVFFIENFWSRFSRDQYCFIYELENDPGLREDGRINYENVTLSGHLIFPWLKENQKGKISLEISRKTNSGKAIINRFKPHIPLYNNTVSVRFSDRDLAMRWKLTWGGKMVTSEYGLI